MKKSLLLGLLFVFPITVFLFLKIFGKNEFDVAPLFQTESENVPTDCGEITYPFVVSESWLAKLNASEKGKVMVVAFKPPNDPKEFFLQIERVMKEFVNDSVVFYYITQNVFGENIATDNSIPLEGEEMAAFRHCGLLLDEQMDAAVVDNEGRIRGQYDLDNLDDADRLIVELDILLKKY